MNRQYIVSFCLTLLLLIFHSVQAKDGKEIIREVKKKYDNLQSLKADFEQIFTWELAGETQSVDGRIYLSDGNRYRIETDTQILVTDGQTVWTYSKNNNQVIIDLLSHSQENPLPKDLLFKYSEDFQPKLLREEKLDERDTYVLELQPKDEEAFITGMKIWIDKDNWFTLKIEQVDINNNVNTYLINNIEDNIELKPGLFIMDIPTDAEIVDLRGTE